MTATDLPEVKLVEALHKSGPDRSEMRKAAEAAGMSRHQMYQALAVASLDNDDFEQAIEGDDPPTITTLGHRAKNKEVRPQSRRLTRCPHCGKNLADKEAARQ